MWLLTLKSVLVARDLEEASGSPLRTAVHLAQLAGAGLHLLHAADAANPDDEARLKHDLRLAAPDSAEPDTIRVIVGSAASVIVERALQVAADVIILGPHRQEGSAGVLGSTASAVVRAAPCPCLVVATPLRLPLDRVIVPIDVTEAAGGTLSVALSWASALRPRGGTARLTVLHVSTSADEPAPSDAMRERVDRARSAAGGAAGVDIDEMVVSGTDPAQEILRAAASGPADLLVLGKRGSPEPSPDLGSVSAAVARATPCPLLLVPPATWADRGP